MSTSQWWILIFRSNCRIQEVALYLLLDLTSTAGYSALTSTRTPCCAPSVLRPVILDLTPFGWPHYILLPLCLWWEYNFWFKPTSSGKQVRQKTRHGCTSFPRKERLVIQRDRTTNLCPVQTDKCPLNINRHLNFLIKYTQTTELHGAFLLEKLTDPQLVQKYPTV
jgi:hypothetical protein